jgi:hypothetical protein
MVGPPPSNTPAGPIDAEQRLEEEAQQLQKELESLEGQLHGHVQGNQTLNHLNQEQEEWLLALEQAANILGEQAQDGKEDSKSMENNCTTVSNEIL